MSCQVMAEALYTIYYLDLVFMKFVRERVELNKWKIALLFTR